jgi:hypothetical protein
MLIRQVHPNLRFGGRAVGSHPSPHTNPFLTYLVCLEREFMTIGFLASKGGAPERRDSELPTIW